MAPHLVRAWSTYKDIGSFSSSHTHTHTHTHACTHTCTHNTHTYTHTHTHTYYKYMHSWWWAGRMRRKKMTNPYAGEKRCVFSFDLKEVLLVCDASVGWDGTMWCPGLCFKSLYIASQPSCWLTCLFLLFNPQSVRKMFSQLKQKVIECVCVCVMGLPMVSQCVHNMWLPTASVSVWVYNMVAHGITVCV